jgi:uncharacterized protein (TIGR00255 family)
MTGYGEAHAQNGALTVLAEVRSVNNRHFKLTCRISDPYDAVEPEVERLVRAAARRGTVQVNLRIDRPKHAVDYRLNLVALESYRQQLESLGPEVSQALFPGLLSLPGVVDDSRIGITHPHDEWPLISGVLEQAIARFQSSRAQEGSVMASELLALGHRLAGELEEIATRVPLVIAAYHERLLERVRGLLKDRVVVQPSDLVREVAILAERSDIAEEITRLRAHIAQYLEVIQGPESAGRKLEFVVQEMGRETNTIGSKANDVTISRHVVEMKASLEKIRELIQNVE